jgi:hypothetical protein
MAVFKRGGVWWYKFYFAGQFIRESSKSTSKTVARDAENQRRRELEQGYHNLHQKREIRIRLLRDIADEYLADYKLRFRGVTFAEYAIGHVVRNLGDKLLVDIGEAEVLGYQTARLKESASAKSINEEVRFLLTMMLELLSVWTLSIPRMGTVRATSIPCVFLTSNQERRLGDPLRRRCFYLVVEHPNPEREAAIVARRTPHADAATHRFIAGLARSLRAYTLEKPPSISEMNDVAMAMELLGIDRILPEHKEIMLPLIAKTEGDRKRLLMKEAFESIVRMAAKYADQIKQDSPGENRQVPAGSGLCQ